MPNIFFTADTHFGHGNIIKYANRPFLHKVGGAVGTPNILAHDNCIIDRCNEVVKRGDILYHLGDLAWSSYPIEQYLSRLNTKEVHLIYGNHDKPKKLKSLLFRSQQEIKSISVNGLLITLCHYPMRSWRNKGHGAYQLYGHCHNAMPGLGRQMDVGVDTHNFYPWALEDVIKKLSWIEFNQREED